MSVDRKLEVKDLSTDQRLVFDAMMAWKGEGGLLTMGGVAGSGKSSILGVFAYETELPVAYVSFTGRAASVLKRKLEACDVSCTNLLQASVDRNGDERPITGYSYGSLSDEASKPFCGTIHRLLYRPIVNDKTGEILGWTKRESLDRGYELIVIDEASMIDDGLLADLQVHGVPILAVGDHGQLPPVMSSGSLMKNPDLRLEKIHRQAEGSSIVQLSRHVRERGRLDKKFANGDTVVFDRMSNVDAVLRDAYANDDPLDVGVLCWTNRNRLRLNGLARAARGIRGPPQMGEIVLWLRNQPPVYNGMRGVLKSNVETLNVPWHLRALIEFPEESLTELSYILCAAQFNREKTFSSLDELHERGINVENLKEAGSLADFGYAMTVHKSQGSSFKHAVFFGDMPEDREDWTRLAYTAVTRASEKLTVLT